VRPALSIALGEAREMEVLLSLEERQKIAVYGLSSVEPQQFSGADVVYRDAGNYKQLEKYVVDLADIELR
jgi:hypothetical protein